MHFKSIAKLFAFSDLNFKQEKLIAKSIK